MRVVWVDDSASAGSASSSARPADTTALTPGWSASSGSAGGAGGSDGWRGDAGGGSGGSGRGGGSAGSGGDWTGGGGAGGGWLWVGATAGNWAGSGDLVVDGAGVEVELDTRVGAGVDSGNVVGGWGKGATTGNVDLSALHVELSAWVVSSGVESDELNTEEVVAWGNASWDLELVSTVCDELVNGPSAAIVTLLVDLEPSAVGDGGGGGIADLGEVGHDWSLVGSINDQPSSVVGVEGVGPSDGDLSTSWDIDNVGREDGERVWSTIASHGSVGDILNWAIVGWESESVELWLSNTVDLELSPDGVCGDNARKRSCCCDPGGALHDFV